MHLKVKCTVLKMSYTYSFFTQHLANFYFLDLTISVQQVEPFSFSFGLFPGYQTLSYLLSIKQHNSSSILGEIFGVIDPLNDKRNSGADTHASQLCNYLGLVRNSLQFCPPTSGIRHNRWSKTFYGLWQLYTLPLQVKETSSKQIYRQNNATK